MFNLLDLARRNRLSGLFPDINNDPSGEQFQVPQDPFATNNSQNDSLSTNPPVLHQYMQDRFNEMLNNFPQREHVGKLRQLGAIIAGAGSDNPMATADQFKNYNYYSKLNDYKTKLPFFQRASENENDVNRQIMNEWSADRKMDETERYNRERNRQVDTAQANTVRHQLETEDNARKLTSVKIWQKDHPDYKMQTGRDGYVYAINPKDPSAQPINTGIQSDKVDDLTKHDWRLDEIDRQNTNALGQIAARGNESRITKSTPSANASGTAGGPKETEANKINRQSVNAKTFQSTYPQWAGYIEMDKTGKVFTKINSKGAKGNLQPLDAQHADEITKIINGQLPMTYYQGGSNKSSSNAPSANRVRVIGPNGETGTMDAAEVSKHPGWKVVK